jgi:hypothetical protein
VLTADIHTIQRCLADRVLAGHHSRLLEAEHRVRSEARAVGYCDLAYHPATGSDVPVRFLRAASSRAILHPRSVSTE